MGSEKGDGEGSIRKAGIRFLKGILIAAAAQFDGVDHGFGYAVGGVFIGEIHSIRCAAFSLRDKREVGRINPGVKGWRSSRNIGGVDVLIPGHDHHLLNEIERESSIRVIGDCSISSCLDVIAENARVRMGGNITHLDSELICRVRVGDIVMGIRHIIQLSNFGDLVLDKIQGHRQRWTVIGGHGRRRDGGLCKRWGTEQGSKTHNKNNTHMVIHQLAP